MAKREARLYVSDVGEFYNDIWTVEAALKGRTKAAEGASTLCSAYQKREEWRNKMVKYLADKRGISFQEMWTQLLTGTYKPLSPEESRAIQDGEDDEDED